MIHLARRHFFNARNEIRWNKEKKMGGINLDGMGSDYIRGYNRGQAVPQHIVQESIDSLNAAINRLDQIINEMKDNCECKKSNFM
jgi:hypothetical protein